MCYTWSVIWSVTMTVRFHLFPFRTQQLSSLVPKIVSWKRLVKIGSRRLLYGPLVKRLRQRPLTPLTSVRFRYGSPYAPLAQLVEQLTLNQWAQGSSPWRCTNKRALNRKIRRSFSLCNPEESGPARSMHGFCTVGFFIGILCIGWNCFEMRGKFCIRSAEPDGAAPLLRGLRSSEVPAEQS